MPIFYPDPDVAILCILKYGLQNFNKNDFSVINGYTHVRRLSFVFKLGIFAPLKKSLERCVEIIKLNFCLKIFVRNLIFGHLLSVAFYRTENKISVLFLTWLYCYLTPARRWNYRFYFLSSYRAWVSNNGFGQTKPNIRPT